MNLIPEKPSLAPNYWCTWNAQHPMWYLRADEELAKFDYYAATEGGNAPRKAMNQRSVFENPGWAVNFWPSLRSDLFLCLDDGWDVPPLIDLDLERWKFGSLILNAERFPDFQGTPSQRLRKINQRAKDLGWRGVALWVAAQCVGDGQDGNILGDAACEAYWRERVRWCADAGIEYWKVDWGARAISPNFRRMLSELVRQEAPGLWVEHARCMEPLNNFMGNGRFGDWPFVFEQTREIMSSSDILRSYDEFEPLRIPIALDRIASLLDVELEVSAKGLINCEDNLYLGAALGCSLGIMRVPVKNPWTKWQWPNVDEAGRAVRWQRIAPPFGVAESNFNVSADVLTDHAVMPADHWFTHAAGMDVQQHAPAVVSRGMALPRVSAPAAQPYVVASRNPNGAVAIAALPRCVSGVLSTPLADVEITLDSASALIGVFGQYKTLNILLPAVPKSIRIWGQDLLSDSAQEITSQISVRDNSILLPGDFIRRLGLSSAMPDDPSDPGLVLRLDVDF